MKTDFNIAHINQASKIQPRTEYILVTDPALSQWDNTNARIALKYFPNSKVINIKGNTENIYYNEFMGHLSALRKVYESLIDEESRKVFRGYWLAKILHRFGEAVYSNTSHYITAGFIPKKDDVFIDVGACDGYTALKFLNLGCKVYAFEMDKINFELTKKLAEEKNFVVENYALGAYPHEMKYIHANGGSNLNSAGSDVARIITLDSYVGENNLSHVDFIKIDTEGAELDILKGAALTIARFKPILAISAYHKPNDFWVLMHFIKSIRPDYEFAMRHYAERIEDYSLFSDAIRNREILNSLGLEPDFRNYHYECVLFAR